MHQIDYRYLRPKKADWLKRMYNTPFAQRSELSVWEGEHATIFPQRKEPGCTLAFGQGGVVDREGNYVPLSGIPNKLDGVYPCEKPEYRDQRVVYCGYLIRHWGHFLVEAVTRLWYFLDAQKDENAAPVDKYVFILTENEEREITGNYREFFQLLGIWDRLEFINRPTTYREVIVPEMAFQCMKYYSPKYIGLFDTCAANVTLQPEWKASDKIFFTRSQFAGKSGYEFGMEALDHFFQKNGYTVLAPENLTLSQMIYYIRSASQVASISGTLPHNMLFGNNGQKLVVIERLVINVDFQVSVNQMRELNAVHIDANFPLYTIDTHGPYMLGYNHLLESYIADHALQPLDPEFASQTYLDKCFKQYMRAYQDNYRYRWHKESWYPEIADSLWEAYEDTYPYFREYIDGNKPFLPEHYFQFHYFKQWIKRLLRLRR